MSAAANSKNFSGVIPASEYTEFKVWYLAELRRRQSALAQMLAEKPTTADRTIFYKRLVSIHGEKLANEIRAEAKLIHGGHHARAA